MKRSMGLRFQSERDTDGGSTARTGWKDQKAFCSGLMTYSATAAGLAAELAGQTAPSRTQRSRTAISESGSLPDGGIFTRGCRYVTASTRSAEAGPDFPPF